MWSTRLSGPVVTLGVALGGACADAPSSDATTTGVSDGVESDGVESDSSSEPPPDVPAGCGNGIVDAGEQCDLGFANADDGPCTLACLLPRCGDGIVAPDEACDEGEDNGGPACSDACTTTSRLRWSVLLDGRANDVDVATAAKAMPGGAVIVVRWMTDALGAADTFIDRYEADGTSTWSTLLPGELIYSSHRASIAATPDGGLLVAQGAFSPGMSLADNVVLWRLSPDGEPLWDYVMGPTPDDQPFRGDVMLANGQIVLVTMHDLGNDEVQSRIARLDDAGNLLEEHALAQILFPVVARADGGLIGVSWNELVGLDADGALEWSTPIASGNESLALDPEGRPLLASDEDSGDRTLRAFSPVGEPLWEIPLELAPQALATGDDGTIAVVGTADASPMHLSNDLDLAVEAFDGAGRRRFFERVAGPGNGSDSGRGVAVGTDGAIWAIGWMWVPLAEADAWIGRFAEDPR